MKNKATAIITASALAIAFLLSACGEKSAAETPTPSTSPTTDVSPSPTADSKYPMVVDAKSSVKVDLNGDGMDDDVYYEPSTDGYSIGHLSVNGTDFTKALYDNGLYTDNLEPKYYCITDIDTSDKMLEIAIMDYGPSDDCVTHFFRYDGTALKYIGNISGLIISSFNDKSDLAFNGDGTISSYMRLGVVQTWFAKVNWKLSASGSFEPVPQDLYYPNSDTGCNVTTRVDITAYEKNDAASAKSTLTKGTALTFFATDNKEWLLAETKDKKQFWIHLDSEYGQDVETPSGYVSSIDSFDGLMIAD